MKIRNIYILLYAVLTVAFAASCDRKETAEEKHLMEVAAARSSGLEYLNQNKLPEAEIEFKKLIELAPDEVMGYGNLGIVYLRQENLIDAELFLQKALSLDDRNIMIRLNLFDLYELMDEQEKAVSQLQKILEYDPQNLFALYKMAEKTSVNPGGSMIIYNDYLLKIIEIVPSNIVPRVYLLEYLLQNGEQEKAMEQMEDIRSKIERLPVESEEYFNQSYEYLRNSNLDEAYTAMIMFHNQLKLSNWYQADINRLMGSKDSRAGIPIISFSQKMSAYNGHEANLVYKNIRFTEVAENASLTPDIKGAAMAKDDSHSFVVVNDFDNDGDQDLFYGVSNSGAESRLYLYRNELGRFEDVFDRSGITDGGKIRNAIFSDYDNDGFPDLLLLTDGSVKLYQNVDELEYKDITSNSGLDEIREATCAVFFDADHDGDLDLFVGTSGQDLLFQNNGNSSFTDISTKAGITEAKGSTDDVVFGDFDDDGDIDFFIANENGNRLYSNKRLGTFEDVTQERGLATTDHSASVSSGDYDNDGYVDLFISNHKGDYKLYKNKGREGFIEDQEFRKIQSINTIDPRDHTFFDFDNDGFLDILLAGDPLAEGTKGLLMLRNNSDHLFEDVSSLVLPQEVKPVRSLAIGDYNEDNDLDIFIGFNDKSIGLLRNDGGNENYQLKIQLVGLREGSGKNNYYGIGSKVEVRAGDLYQMRTMVSQNEYFGLGSHERADVLRIRWTNGVPQNIFSPNSDLDLIEQQKLKGSCPFLYTWNGERFVFVKDMMWRSALGMPLGIMSSNDSRTYAFPHASREYLLIPGEMLKPQNGRYDIKITGELWETIYLDELVLYAVDHPKEVDVRLDEKFVLPPFPDLNIYSLRSQHAPISATDGRNDLLNKIVKKDQIYIDNFRRTEFQGITELKDLILNLGEGIPTDSLYLFLNGWIFPSDASINVAVSQSRGKTVIPPYLQVLNERGQWETVIKDLGFPLGKDKTIVADLSKAFKSNDRKIRIRTSMQIYWDHIFYSYVNEPFKGTLTPMVLSNANLDYGGFSTEYRNEGRNGPHWFDYQHKTMEPKWMDLEGQYTRYGNVSSLLDSADNQYIIYNAGDEVSLSYSLGNLPELADGWQRDFVIYSVGWVKDGDLNTAQGQTVTPLPFHGMSAYPYPENENYPFKENSEYLREYNNRTINSDRFRDLLKVPK